MNEKLKTEFVQKGCKNERDAAVALQVYLNLCEVKKYWEVNYYYHDTLEKLYFTARIKKRRDLSVFVPLAVPDSISFDYLKGLFQLQDIGHTIYVVMVHSDSTCVYYQITDGLGEPPSLEPRPSHKMTSQKLDAELSKHFKLLEEAALCGIPITIAKDKHKKVK